MQLLRSIDIFGQFIPLQLSWKSPLPSDLALAFFATLATLIFILQHALSVSLFRLS